MRVRGGRGGGGVNKSTYISKLAQHRSLLLLMGGWGWYHSKVVPFEFSGEGCDRMSSLDGIVSK